MVCDHCRENVSGYRLQSIDGPIFHYDGPLCCNQCGNMLGPANFSPPVPDGFLQLEKLDGIICENMNLEYIEEQAAKEAAAAAAAAKKAFEASFQKCYDDLLAARDLAASVAAAVAKSRKVDGYLRNEEEKHYKQIMWENMNPEYLVEQAAKEAAAAAAKKAFQLSFQNCYDDLLAARELAASPAAAVAKSRKRPSSKVNYDRLENLFDEPEQAAKEAAATSAKKAFQSSFQHCYDDLLEARELAASSAAAVAKSRKAAPENLKKVQFELPSDNHSDFDSQLEDKIKDDAQGSDDEYEDIDMGVEYEDVDETSDDEDVYSEYDDYVDETSDDDNVDETSDDDDGYSDYGDETYHDEDGYSDW